MKTALRCIVGILLLPVVLFVVLTAALYIPPIQNWAANTAARLATEGTGVNVGIGRVGLSFPLDIDMRRVLATDDEGDTLLSVNRLVVDLDMARILALSIGVDEISLEQGRADTKNLIEGLSLGGSIGRLAIAAPQGIDLKRNTVAIDAVEADACDLYINIVESEPDTTETEPLPWQIEVGRIALGSTRLQLSMDSLYADLRIDAVTAGDVQCLLEKEEYAAERLSLKGEASVWLPAFIPDTINLDGIDVGADRLKYSPQQAEVKSLVAQMLHSHLTASARAALPVVAFDANLSACIDRRDLLFACSLLDIDTTGLSPALPQESLTFALEAGGSMKRVAIRQAKAALPGVFSLAAEGVAGNLDDMQRLMADVGFEAEAFDLTQIKRALDFGPDIRLPKMQLSGRAKADGQKYEGRASLSVDERQVAALQGRFDASSENYGADIDITGFAPQTFMPSLPVGPLTAKVTAQGVGFDPFSLATSLTARAEVKRCVVDSIDLRDVCLAASYRARKASLLLDCNNRLIDGNIGMSAIVKSRDSLDAQFTLDLNKLDLYGLHIVEKPLQMGGTVHLDGKSNLKDTHTLHGGMTQLTLLTADTVFHPKDILLNTLVRRDSLAADISAGDLTLGFTAGCGIDSLQGKTDAFLASLDEQLKLYRIDQEQLRLLLPKAEVKVSMGDQNPAANIARAMGYTIGGFRLRLGANPTVGLNGGVFLDRLSMGAVTLDEMWCNIYQDSTGVKMDARVHNGPKNPQISFDARAKAYILPGGAGFNVTYTDDRGRKGVDIGTEIDILPDGIKMHLTPLTPIMANRRFEVNADNFVFMAPDGRVSANLDLLADDGTGMKLYSAEGDSTTLQDLTLSLHNVNVHELCSVIPYMPQMAGMMYGDVHLVQSTQNLSVALDGGVDNLSYEGAPLGNLGLNATYLPVGDSCHCVNALLTRNGEEIAALDGTYTDDGGDGQIEAEAELMHLPLEMIGGMAGDPTLFAMGGDMDGVLAVTGKPAAPRIDGYITTNGVTIASPAYSINLRVNDDTVSIKRSKLELNAINMYSTGRNPLVMDGWIDFSDLSNVSLDTRLSASRFELINAKRSAASAAYGKVLVDANATLRGNLSRLNMYGRLGVLGGTDVTYILQDSPLTVEDRLADLVTFTDFNDTIAREEPEEAPPMALTMNMQVSVDQSAQVHCLLSADRSSYIDIEGGGDLTIGYNPQGDITLNGRYTILSGEMKYALPVIPLKTFKLESGSYVAWTGNMMNPQLNISATERTRAAVTSETGANRSVAFDVGVDITQTLENMGLAFTIEAPEDAAIQNELQAMDQAARGRVAVTMLATGMYITDTGSSGGFSTTNALNTFLQSEIMGIAGKALNSIDVNVGVEEGTGATGGSTTDYSFSFAKRFWNNRISVSFGGRVSSGSDAENTGATIIDNVSVEYRLDQSATRYVRLSYDKNYESLLEGTITEMGAGLVLRRKTTKLGELFIFRRRKE